MRRTFGAGKIIVPRGERGGEFGTAHYSENRRVVTAHHEGAKDTKGHEEALGELRFGFPNIGPLSEADAKKAISDPTKAVGVAFEPAALDEIFRLTQGYPYFLQEWGYQSWNRAVASPITLQVVREATKRVIERLDENFFRVRFDRLTPGEKRFLRARAGLGQGAHRSSAIAESLKLKLSSLGPARANLIRKGMIYSPAHGDMAFTVPLFDEFMLRAMP